MLSFQRPIPVNLLLNVTLFDSSSTARQFFHCSPTSATRPSECSQSVLEVSEALPFQFTQTDAISCSAYLSFANSSAGGVDRELDNVVPEKVKEILA